MTDLFGQGGYPVRFDWGLAGARAMGADVTVVVDVLSFSTSVTIAVERGIDVLPYRWNDSTAADFARESSAQLALGRLEALKLGSGAPSLSPASLLVCDPIDRLVLPSPNGSTISLELSIHSEVVAGCLRNARAVGEHIRMRVDAGQTVGVVAAGERWAEDDSLRPAVEDLIGAGAILSSLRPGHGYHLSPEAELAADSFDAARERLTDILACCVGGQELAVKGFATDVSAAAALDDSSAVPILKSGAFQRATQNLPSSTG